MAAAGFDPEAVRRGRSHFTPAALNAFIEVHIEQGPVLEQSGTPLGIVTGIRGGLRYRAARCLGAYGHSGAEPRRLRRDAVFALSHLVVELDTLWRELETAGADLTITVGQFTTDPEMHAFSKVPGEVRFSLDVRSQSVATMDEVHRRFLGMCERTAGERGVRFELGPLTRSTPALMDDALRARMTRIARDLGIPALEMASGAGHDAAIFANAGVPTAMLFIRNANGSHNPDEAMAMEDFAAAATVLIDLLAAG
jgi:N-carbamoyl-L-amino-acid hydrolase